MRAGSVLLVAALLSVFASCGDSPDDNGKPDFGVIDMGFVDQVVTTDGEEPLDAVEDKGPPPVVNDQPAAELYVKITGPSGSGYATAPGGSMSISGVIFGKFLSVNWLSSSGASGTATWSAGAPFWQTDAIPLAPGDNLITVTAMGEAESQSDKIVITYNPSFLFPNPVEVRPPAVFVGDTQTLYATMALGPFGDLADSKLTLQQVTDNGGLVQELGPMYDDGKLMTSGDEIPKDGVYTSKFSLTCSSQGPIYIRAAAQVQGIGGVYTALSAPSKIECLNRLATGSCNAHLQTLGAARDAFFAKVDAGDPNGARQAAIDLLKADAAVVETAGPAEGGGLWARFNDGVLGAVNTARGGVRGGGAGDGQAAAPSDAQSDLASVTSAASEPIAIASKDTMLLAPFASEFAADDEASFVASVALGIDCPVFSLKGPYNGSEANLAKFRRLNENGVIVISTHGEVYFQGLSAEHKRSVGWNHLGAQEVLWTGEQVNCANLTTATVPCSSNSDCPTGTQCLITQSSVGTDLVTVSGVCFDATQADLMMGRAVLGDKTYGITPAFVLHHAKARKFPNSVVYLGACRSLWNGSMAAAFFATGAKSIAGFSNVVTSSFAGQMGKQFFAQMMEQDMTTGQSYNVGAQDPGNPGSFFRMFGGRNVTISNSDLLNASFETGDLTAWDKEGDGRILTKLGTAKPVQGKFMGIISTGLGFTVSNGAIEQRFCIPAGTSQLTFYWKYYSEEFKEYCGSIYQDTFQAKLVDKFNKEYQVVNLKVDDICSASDCFSGCGAAKVSLTKSDVVFDQGDNWKTDWQKKTYSLGGLVTDKAVPVTLRFYTTDKGDSIYDTAVLFDSIKFE